MAPVNNLKRSQPPASVAKVRRGRPSIATEQRARIIEAFVKAMRRHGLSGATVDRVAKSLGISRTLIFHYFGDMKVLTRSVVEYIVRNWGRDFRSALEGLSVAERRKMLVDFAVAGTHVEQLRDVAVLADVWSLAGQDAGVAAMLSEMWDEQVAVIVDAVTETYPQASRTQCEAVGYAVACFGEQHWWLTYLGPGRKRTAEARKAVEALLATLNASPAASEPKRGAAIAKIRTRGK